MNDLHTKHLDQVDPADEEGHQASEDGGEDVKEDQGEQVDCGLTEVVNLLPLKIVAFHITCGQTIVRSKIICQTDESSPRLTALGPS